MKTMKNVLNSTDSSIMFHLAIEKITMNLTVKFSLKFYLRAKI